MTKTDMQREQINSLLIQYGATLDRWQRYNISEYIFDTRGERNLKIYKGKVKIYSNTFIKTKVEEIERMLKRIVGK
jgi:hypothetical protein